LGFQALSLVFSLDALQNHLAGLAINLPSDLKTKNFQAHQGFF
jgi:hypothetical protein